MIINKMDFIAKNGPSSRSTFGASKANDSNFNSHIISSDPTMPTTNIVCVSSAPSLDL
ncbi:hypothetical protein COCNU_06G011300 [Cocos nucifera]|uniref:Uncharacterized protein n=1 Tax=Cocos nucifera TaxID=13894 RepID=A0A8K0N361_COCNU|nr:hypothetical protein COCNU_06G011300 [Cocos nucifera]